MIRRNLVPWRNKESEETTTGTALSRFHSEIDRLFDRFFNEPGFAFPRTWAETGEFGRWAPSLDVSETDDEFRVNAELPGIDPDDLDISISGDVLTISGEKKEEREEERGGYYRTERRFGSFSRSVPLSSVDADNITADYENGVLTVRLPKTEKSAAKRIPVSVGKK